MGIPVLRAVIERRILVNYRVDAERLRAVLPEPFEPQLVDGIGVAGVCLIRLRRVRPQFLPMPWGFRSENAAHRIAVVPPDGSPGVYIPRRDTDSWINTIVGGRLFAGAHHHASFVIEESQSRFSVAMHSDDGATAIEVVGHVTEAIPAGSVFRDVDVASEFFEQGSLGYSDTSSVGRFDGLELRTTDWRVTPLEIDHLRSSFFDDQERFPSGSATFDNALLMQNVDHRWLSQDSLTLEPLTRRLTGSLRMQADGLLDWCPVATLVGAETSIEQWV